jgi:hypothetical protein
MRRTFASQAPETPRPAGAVSKASILSVPLPYLVIAKELPEKTAPEAGFNDQDCVSGPQILQME